jgi:hypothetical protein
MYNNYQDEMNYGKGHTQNTASLSNVYVQTGCTLVSGILDSNLDEREGLHDGMMRQKLTPRGKGLLARSIDRNLIRDFGMALDHSSSYSLTEPARIPAENKDLDDLTFQTCTR